MKLWSKLRCIGACMSSLEIPSLINHNYFLTLNIGQSTNHRSSDLRIIIVGPAIMLRPCASAVFLWARDYTVQLSIQLWYLSVCVLINIWFYNMALLIRIVTIFEADPRQWFIDVALLDRWQLHWRTFKAASTCCIVLKILSHLIFLHLGLSLLLLLI